MRALLGRLGVTHPAGLGRAAAGTGKAAEPRNAAAPAAVEAAFLGGPQPAKA